MADWLQHIIVLTAVAAAVAYLIRRRQKRKYKGQRVSLDRLKR